jgi:DNA helicase-2/ATP-dependent DNA helicase PcrA
MRVIADLHVHSRYSRATSPDMEPGGMALWAQRKGITVVGTGDFTHPEYLALLNSALAEAEEGLYRLKAQPSSPVRFLASAEVSHIYKHAGKVRKVHHLILAPSLRDAGRIQKALAARGNVESDGRPIFGITSQDLLSLVLDLCPQALLIPAHAWTPWFSVFGSKSGYDSLEECFGPQAKFIKAVETGLSSDRPMNRRCSMLDGLALISNSDAHSPSKLGREANVLDCPLSFAGVAGALTSQDAARFPYTIEFFPEEGKYHWDGHRDCKVRMLPRESKERGDRCPVCFKPLTLGVMHRVDDLADRAWDETETGDPTGQRQIVPLPEILSEVMDCGPASKKVQAEYLRVLSELGDEFSILLDRDLADIRRLGSEKLAEAIGLMRQGKVSTAPGYDGVFGKVSFFGKVEGDFTPRIAHQMKLI